MHGGLFNLSFPCDDDVVDGDNGYCEDVKGKNAVLSDYFAAWAK